MCKLFNKSRIPDAVLEPLLTAAGRAVGARTSGVVVKVHPGRNGGVSGVAHQCYEVYKWHLWRGGSRKKGIKTDGGYFEIVIPRPSPGWDFLGLAEQVFKVAAHEWYHIHDYQKGGRWAMPFARAGASGRRPLHDRRPEELRAINAVDEAVDRGALRRNQDAIIALAIEMEKLASAALKLH